MNVAAIFCAENLDLSSPAEAFARCSNSLSASIIERIRYPLDAPSGYDSATKQQQQDKLRTKTVEPWLTVPLNVNGLETVLQIYWGSSPDDLAADFCRREEFGFYGSWFDSCFTQAGIPLDWLSSSGISVGALPLLFAPPSSQPCI